MIDKIELKKDLYRSKAIAKLEYYDPANGDMLYNVEALGKTWKFPIHTITKTLKTEKLVKEGVSVDISVETLTLTDDLKGAKFESEMRGSSLIRWIEQAIDNNEFH